MTEEQIMVDLFDFSAPTYYKWKKHEKRKIFGLLETYFTKADLEEFLSTGKISKYEGIKQGTQDLILAEVQNNSKMLSEIMEALRTSEKITK
jgi:hypothetical protein